MSNYEIRLRCDGKTQSRTGKIARLPYKIREEVNRRLRDNVPGDKICEWLNRLPAAKTVCKEFARRSGKERSPITPNQLSEWRRGGFRDWLMEQQVLEETREMTQWSMKLAKDSGGELSEGAAVLLSGQLLKVLRGMACFGKVQSPMSRETSNFKSEGLNPKSERNPNDEIRTGSAGGQSSAEPSPLPSPIGWEREETIQRSEKFTVDGENTSRLQGELLRVADPRSGEAEQMEWSVRVLAALVKCLSGIRRGDQNRVRLALSEKKLALRDKVVTIECEKYAKEKAAQEELARKKRAEERQKKRSSGLSDRGAIDWVRGETFGQERIIRDKEAELKEVQRDLEILKAKWHISGSASEGGGQKTECGGQPVEDGGPKMEDSPQPAPAKAGTPNCAPSGCESVRVIPSPSDQSVVKEDGGFRIEDGGSKVEDGGHTAPAITGMPNGATGRREDAKAQGAKKFDVQAALREVQQIEEELAALQVKFPVSESSSEHLQDAESNVQCPKSNVVCAPGKSEPEFSTLSWEEQTRWLEKFPEEALRKLEEIKNWLAALKAKRQVSSSAVLQENGS